MSGTVTCVSALIAKCAVHNREESKYTVEEVCGGLFQNLVSLSRVPRRMSSIRRMQAFDISDVHVHSYVQLPIVAVFVQCLSLCSSTKSVNR